MKQIILLTCTLFTLLICSCSNNNDIDTYNEVTISENNYSAFLAKIDSINSLYVPNPNVKKAGVLSYVLKNKAEKVADTGGNVVGGWIGKYIGTGVGAAMGNPVIAASGYVIGRSVGRVVGGVLASYGSKLLVDYIDKRFLRAPPKGIFKFSHNRFHSILYSSKTRIDNRRFLRLYSQSYH